MLIFFNTNIQYNYFNQVITDYILKHKELDAIGRDCP